MTCDGCGDRLREVIALAEGLRALARSGALQVVISDYFVERAVETGLQVREYAPPPGGAIQCTVAADDDLLVSRLALSLTTASRVDLSWCDPQGVEHHRMSTATTSTPLLAMERSIGSSAKRSLAFQAPPCRSSMRRDPRGRSGSWQPTVDRIDDPLSANDGIPDAAQLQQATTCPSRYRAYGVRRQHLQLALDIPIHSQHVRATSHPNVLGLRRDEPTHLWNR